MYQISNQMLKQFLKSTSRRITHLWTETKGSNLVRPTTGLLKWMEVTPSHLWGVPTRVPTPSLIHQVTPDGSTKIQDGRLTISKVAAWWPYWLSDWPKIRIRSVSSCNTTIYQTWNKLPIQFSVHRLEFCLCIQLLQGGHIGSNWKIS